MKKFSCGLAVATAAMTFIGGLAHAENIRIAFVDPLSGPFSAAGINSMRGLQYSVELANKNKWAGEHTFEIVGFDNKNSPQESVTLVKAVVDQGIHYIATGGSSGAALAMVDAVNKHNARNAGQEIVILNYSSVDPSLTNANCSFWHFRYDAHIGMKTEAMTAYMAKKPEIKKVYLIGQNYVSGVQFNQFTRESLKRKRPDIEIVGEDLHPIGTVKDFAPYIAKIKQSGADAIATGNWGLDLVLLVRAAQEAGLKADVYTYHAALRGTPEAMGEAGENRVFNGVVWHPNIEGQQRPDLVEGFQKKFGEDFSMGSTYTSIASLAEAVKQAKSTDTVKVAFALENVKLDALNGKVEMRKEDHQLQQPFYVARWVKTNGKDVRYDQEKTGLGWKTEMKVDAAASTQPTTCAMQRPGKL